ncbi:MAG: hypothetical protein VW685_10285 [Ilumatobacter sp.]
MSATPRSAETSDLPGVATLLDAVWADLDQPIAHSAEELAEEFDSTATSLADVMVWESDNGDLSAVGYTLLLAGDDLARC